MKGSYTVEAAVVVSLFLFVIAGAMQIGIHLLEEVRSECEQEQNIEFWAVEDFYHYQMWKGAVSSE